MTTAEMWPGCSFRVDLPPRDGLLILPEPMLQRAVAKIPPGFDRAFVNSAAPLDLHVKGILSHRDVRPFGLLLR